MKLTFKLLPSINLFMETILYIAIVEDQQDDYDSLKKCLDTFSIKNNVEFKISYFENAVLFLKQYRSDFDIVFMDIDMPTMNGLEAAESLRKIDEEVLLIFITNLVQLAIKGYSVSAFDFVSKPLNYSQFSTLMTKALKKISYKKRKEIIINSNRKNFRIDALSLLYVEVVNHSLIYHTTSNEINSWGSLAKVYEELKTEGFVKINKSIILNLRFVKEVDGFNIILTNGETLYLSRLEKKSFLEKFTRFVVGD